jgi:hypothetical protein
VIDRVEFVTIDFSGGRSQPRSVGALQKPDHIPDFRETEQILAIKVTFNKAVDRATLTRDSFLVQSNGRAYPGIVREQPFEPGDDHVAVFIVELNLPNPPRPFEQGDYTVVTSNLLLFYGFEALRGDYSLFFSRIYGRCKGVQW